ncbi:MAG: hypothetical protein ACXW3F_13100, partial [Pyrinomonadaceae bacterium]
MRTRVAVFLITLSGLILEVGLTRIYSASIWYHFAFVAISVALLGWGLGGFTVHLLRSRSAAGVGGRETGAGARAARADENLISDAAVSSAPSPNLSQRERNQTAGEAKAEGGKQETDGRRQEAGVGARTLSMNAAAVTTLLYAGAIPLCLWLLVRYPFEMDRLPLYFLAPLLPFFLAGMALSIVFDIHRAVAGSLYFWDLIGASIGALAVTILLHLFGGEAALLVATIAPAIAAGLLSLSPASRAEENKNNVSDPGVAPSGLTPGYSLSRLQRESSGQDARAPIEALSPASRAQE